MLNAKIKTIISAVVFALLIAGAVITYNLLGSRLETPNTINADGSSERLPAPDFSMIDTQGNTVRLSDMTGKPIVLNFWASWCPPCRIEMPDFDRVYKELGQDVHFMMVCLVDGRQEIVESGSAYIMREGFSFPVYFDTRQEGARAYGIRSIPTTLFIDSEGYIAAGVQGAINERTLRRGIELIN
jgi:thiol-disulfide isomerase/thioredoxin